MSKKIAKKKVIKKKTSKKVKVGVNGPLKGLIKKVVVTNVDPNTPIKEVVINVHGKVLAKIAKSKSVNHLFSRDERLDQDLFLIADIGKEVVISSDEVEFINKAFEDFKKAQEILKRYA